MKRFIFTFLCFFLLFSCTVMKVSERTDKGFFQSSKNAMTTKSIDINLDEHRQLLIVPNGQYMKGMSEAVGYFDRIITFETFEEEIIAANKQDEVGALSGKIGLNNAYRKFKPFLYIKFDSDPNRKGRLQLKLVNPDTTEELFIADTLFDTVWAGVYDNNTFNPLFNELIKYIERRSTTYSKEGKRYASNK